MNDIVVFTTPETKDVSLNKTEQEIMYDNFIKTKSLDVHHFQSFMEMENQKKSENAVKSSMPSITIKKILNYCIPIIKEVPKFSVKTEKVDIFKKKKVVKKTVEYFNISTQLENDIVCKFDDDKMNDQEAKISKMVVPKHTNFKIIGVVIPPILNKSYDTVSVNFFKSQTMQDLLTTGCFGLTEFQSNTFIQSFIKTLQPNNKNEIIVKFKDYSKTSIQIDIIHKYIKYVHDYYEKNIVMLYQYMYTTPFSEHIKYQKKWYNIFNPKLNEPISFEKSDAITNRITDILNIASGNSKLSNAFILEKNDVYDTYKKIKLVGDSTPLSKALFHQMKSEQETIKKQVQYKKEKFIKNLEYAKKKAISINKFNITNIDKLTTQQRKIVELEYDKLEKFYKNSKKYKDEFDVVSSLMWANENGRKKLIEYKLKDVMEKIKIPKNVDLEKMTEMFKSKKYSVNLVCPHAIARAKKTIARGESDVKQSGEIRQYMINNFSLPKTTDGYYCKICGHLLADADDESVIQFISGKKVSQFIEHDRLRMLIWKESAHIITSYVKFKEVVDYKSIINAITNSLRGELGSIENTLLKIKSNSKDGIKELMSVYTSIYVFALVVHMIEKNYGHITFSLRPPRSGAKKSAGQGKKNVRGAGQGKKGNIIQNIINNALYLILRIKNVTLNNLSSMKPESIKPILIKAYKWSSNLQTTKITPAIDDLTDKADLNRDPIFVYGNYVFNQLQYKNKQSKTASIADILGRTWEKIESEFAQNISMYATLNLYENWGDSYKHKSYEKIAKYTKDKVYTLNAQPYSDALKAHDQEYKHLLEEDVKRNADYALETARPYASLNLLENFMLSFNDFRPQKIHIDKYYDNNGIKHNFNIFVYQSANSNGVLSGPKKDFNVSDRIKLLKTNDEKHYKIFNKMHMVDMRCSICKVLWSQTKNKTVDKALKKKEDKIIFYKYYENKCPKGELHTYKLIKNIETCSKCGITAKDINLNSDKYYNKFMQDFIKTQKKQHDINKHDIDELMKNAKEKTYNKTFPKWKIDNSAVLQLSRAFKIKYNIWINLGLTINQYYSSIEKEQINPSINITYSLSKLRNLQLHNYYLRVVKFLYTIKNYDIVEFIPYDLKSVMDKNKVRDLHKKLINSDTDVLAMYNYYKSNELPSVVSNFLLYQISNLLLKIYKSMKQNNMKIAHELIEYIIGEILKSEKLLATPNLTSFSTTIFNTNSAEVDGNIVSDDDNVIVDSESSVDDGKNIYEMSDTSDSDIFDTGDLDMGSSDEDADMHADF